MKIKKFRTFVGDFETTVYEGQKHTEVWASAIVELYSEDVKIFKSIDETFEYLSVMKDNVIVYYHNLKFDGSFWLSYLLVDRNFKQAYNKTGERINDVEWQQEKEMKNNTFKYSISDKGQFYTIIIKVNNKFIEIRDSLKLLPFSVKKIGKSFETKHKKLDMEYTGFRYSGCEITLEEQEYIKNDVLVVKEALEIMYNEGHNKLTIGSCCLEEYKKLIGKDDYSMYFPNLTEIELDKDTYGSFNAEEYIRKSYRGGWCYVVKGKENKIYENGVTADVNSLYPSVMSSESGNRYPVGKPYFWKGNFIDEEALKTNRYFFIRIKTRFYIKKNKLPFIQVKGNLLYNGREMLETSDIYDAETDTYCKEILDFNGNLVSTRVELTLTMTDYYLIKEHYDLVDFEILDGVWFYTEIGIFDRYIEKYKKIKTVSTGAKRELAKLFLNNLYGKMATSTDSSFKVAYVKEDKSIGFLPVLANDKKPVYIPIGSAITSYARNFTIRTAQKNYYGVDKRGFIYADTDSIHCDLDVSELKDVPVHDSAFCHWKLEALWDKGIFVRAKTYIEHVTHENLKPVEPYNNIKCAGMPQKCKDLLNLSLEGYTEEEYEALKDVEKKFVKTKRTFKDFKRGLIVPSKLRPKRINGGIILCDTTYEMR